MTGGSSDNAAVDIIDPLDNSNTMEEENGYKSSTPSRNLKDKKEQEESIKSNSTILNYSELF